MIENQQVTLARKIFLKFTAQCQVDINTIQNIKVTASVVRKKGRRLSFEVKENIPDSFKTLSFFYKQRR